jgi:hypothetical protein
MVSVWLAILAAAVGVFLASFITHMVLPYHRTDVRKLPGQKEDALLAALQGMNVTPGDYGVPHAGGPAGMREPEFIAKATAGPLAFITIAPGSAPSMGPYLAMWFLYCLVVSGCLGLLSWYIIGPGQPFSYVFHIVSAIGFLAYGAALPQMSILYRRSWTTTVKSLFDSAIYGAMSGAVFGWLWPQ